MSAHEAKQKVEELTGRRDALKGELKRAQAEHDKFASQNLQVEAREANDDCGRLRQRLEIIERELTKLKKYW